MKFYIATGFKNVVEHNRVRDILVKEGHEITYDWTLVEETSDSSMHSLIAIAEIEGVREADFLVVILPGKLGTHAELGAALALDKPIILCGEMEPGNRGLDCIFHLHPNVERFKSFDDWYQGSVFNSRWPCGIGNHGLRPVGT